MIACLNWAHNCHSGFSFSCLLSYLLHYFIIISFCSFFDLSFFHVGIYCLEVDLLIIFRLLVQSYVFRGFSVFPKNLFWVSLLLAKGLSSDLQFCTFPIFLFYLQNRVVFSFLSAVLQTKYFTFFSLCYSAYKLWVCCQTLTNAGNSFKFKSKWLHKVTHWCMWKGIGKHYSLYLRKHLFEWTSHSIIFESVQLNIVLFTFHLTNLKAFKVVKNIKNSLWN